MNAQSIIETCKDYINNKINSIKKVKGIVTSISGTNIYVRPAWADMAWDVPIKKYKHVEVTVGDLVEMEPYGNTYIIVGVIE